MSGRVRCLALALLWLAWPGAILAACELPGKIGPKPLLQVLQERELHHCFGDEKDSNALSVQILKIKECAIVERGDVEMLRQRLVSAANDLDAETRSLSEAATVEWQPLAVTLRTELSKARESLASVDAIPPATLWTWSDHKALEGALDYEPIVSASCPAATAPACPAAMATTVRVTRVVNLTNHLLRCAGQSKLEETRKALKKLDAEWDHYFFGTRSQFVWELAINSWRFKAPDDKLAAPPTDQIILLHPGVAFEYVGRDAGREDAYEAIILAEVIGYNRFAWKPRKDGTPSRLPPLGASLVVTYTPDNIGERVGYGVLIHAWNTLSLGFSRRDTGAGEEFTWLLSGDLMRFVIEPSPEAIARFRGKGTAVVSAQ